ncbi:Hypothetical protein A7982_02109 [Minicystis rosea]|nr:Hypothetical protein A7982_02109 [Minicystis rosea]
MAELAQCGSSCAMMLARGAARTESAGADGCGATESAAADFGAPGPRERTWIDAGGTSAAE